ncbi:MAG: T9SS type A sorting domain-containing protein [Bacteroidia bacterium]
MKNSYMDGGNYYFDIYLQQAGDAPILMAFSDFVFEVSPAQSGLQFHYQPNSSYLVNAFGAQINYNNLLRVDMRQRSGIPVAIINADAPEQVNQQNYMHRLARIDAQAGQHRLGRFYISNFMGNLNDFDLNMLLDAHGANSKVYSFVPQLGLQAMWVNVDFIKPDAASQRAVRSIAAGVSGDKVELKWVSSFEENLVRYRVQRSFDRKNWHVIEDVAPRNLGAAIQEYKVVDARPQGGQRFDGDAQVYYRIEVADSKGGVAISPEKKVVIHKNINFSIYPNPARDVVFLKLESQEVSNIDLRVYDIQGRKVFEQKLDGVIEPAIDLYPFSAGAYIVQLQSGSRHNSSRLIILK